jgi:metallo-beta-lactamase class B
MFGRVFAPVSMLVLAVAPQAARVQDDAGHKAWTDTCGDWDEWDKPGPPYRVHGNTWYVGTCGIGAILITGDEGHVLIDSGTEEGAQIVAANIEALGFKPGDVKRLLMSHEHFDHVGGVARLQQLTGAPLVASRRAAPVMRTGITDPADPQAGMHEPFAGVAKVEELPESGIVNVGGLELHAIATPGHTPGALSWHWRSCEDDRCLTIAYADSLSPVSRDDYRFSDHPGYLEEYRAGIDRLAALRCDIVLTPHPSASGMRERLVERDLARAPSCSDYAAAIQVRLDERLLEEAGAE